MSYLEETARRYFWIVQLLLVEFRPQNTNRARISYRHEVSDDLNVWMANSQPHHAQPKLPHNITMTHEIADRRKSKEHDMHSPESVERNPEQKKQALRE